MTNTVAHEQQVLEQLPGPDIQHLAPTPGKADFPSTCPFANVKSSLAGTGQAGNGMAAMVMDKQSVSHSTAEHPGGPLGPAVTTITTAIPYILNTP